MRKLFQSIFGEDTGRTTSYPETLIARAIARALDGTDPRLRLVSGISVCCVVDSTSEARLAEIHVQLRSLPPDAASSKPTSDILTQVLDTPDRQLWTVRVTMIVAHDRATGADLAFELDEFHSADGRMLYILPVLFSCANCRRRLICTGRHSVIPGEECRAEARPPRRESSSTKSPIVHGARIDMLDSRFLAMNVAAAPNGNCTQSCLYSAGRKAPTNETSTSLIVRSMSQARKCSVYDAHARVSSHGDRDEPILRGCIHGTVSEGS